MRNAKAGCAIEYGRAPSDDAPNEVRLARNRRCLTLLHEAGLGAISWPTEYGGQGLTHRHQVIFNHEVAGYSLPLGMFIIGHGMCAPTLLAYGTDHQKHRHLPPLLRGDEIWCQLFSEPGAGSDLAAVQCRAERDGDDWIITGQKVWTSGAHNAAFGLLLARSDPSASRHAGLTTFIIDMSHPDVDVRGLRDMSGATRFNEVFFDECRLGPGALLGEVGAGWKSAITTLMNERVSIGTSPGGFGQPLGVLVSEARRRGIGTESRPGRTDSELSRSPNGWSSCSASASPRRSSRESNPARRARWGSSPARDCPSARRRWRWRSSGRHRSRGSPVGRIAESGDRVDRGRPCRRTPPGCRSPAAPMRS